jgi:hypothetical protein
MAARPETAERAAARLEVAVLLGAVARLGRVASRERAASPEPVDPVREGAAARMAAAVVERRSGPPRTRVSASAPLEPFPR